MALISTTHLPKADFIKHQQEAQAQVEENPFGNLNLEKVKFESDPNYGYNQQAKQPISQNRASIVEKNNASVSRSNMNTIQRTQVANNTNVVRKTSNGRTIKRTRNGDPYVYDDVYNHNGDIKFKRSEEEHYDLRMPKGQKAQFMQIAKNQKMSFNQMVLRAIDSYINRFVR